MTNTRKAHIIKSICNFREIKTKRSKIS
jgi:hypothetical protein